MAVRAFLIVIALAALAAGGPGAAVAAPASPAAPAPPVDLETLAGLLAVPERQRDAVAALDRLDDPAAEAVLRALKDGALYRWRGRPVILGGDGGVTDVRGRPLPEARLDAAQESVALDEALFGVVQRALERFEVLGGSAAQRRAAAARLGDTGDPAAAGMLARALAREPDPGVRALMEEALARLRLAAPDAATRAEAARLLARARSQAAVGRLRALAAEDPDPAARAAAREALRSLESYFWLRDVAGYVFNGVSLGAVLLTMSVGLAVTFGLMGIINMAHGEMLMIGSYTAYVVQEAFARYLPARQDHYFLVALPLAFLAAGLVGFVLETTIIRFLYGRPLETLIVTWGVGMVLQQGARLAFGDQTSVNPPTWLRGGPEVLAGLVLPWSRLFIVALAVAVLGALALLLQRSWAGLEVRAVMQNRAMAACLGVSTRRIDAVTFALGTGLAGVAGCALSLIGTVDPEVGKTYIVDAFMVVVLGGVGRLVGTVVASLGVGLASKLLEPAIGGTAAAVYAKVAVLGAVIWFLQWRPTGLFPQRGRAAAEAA